jgi:hypothetical protein
MMVCALTQFAQESIVATRAVHCDIEKCMSKIVRSGRMGMGLIYIDIDLGRTARVSIRRERPLV